MVLNEKEIQTGDAVVMGDKSGAFVGFVAFRIIDAFWRQVFTTDGRLDLLSSAS